MRGALSTFNEVWQREFRTRILAQSRQFSADTQFLVGCSGGVDSMLLLYVMCTLYPKRVRAIHIDHQLQSISSEWAIFVDHYAQYLDIPLRIQQVTVATGNLESEARNARYQAFKSALNPNEILVLAHHQQDQAETVLLRLLSGAGVDGLSAMLEFEQRDEYQLWRPFLSLSRERIESWASQLNVPFVQDMTNFDIHYDRAWCRQVVWPLLKARYPKMQEALSRTSVLMQDSRHILQEVLQLDLNACGNHEQLDLERLAQLSEARQRQLLSSWMKGDDQYRPSFDMVERLKREVILARPDAQAMLRWNAYYYTRYQSTLYRLPKQVYMPVDLPSKINIDFSLEQKLSVASGQFKIKSVEQGLSPLLLNQNLTLCSRQGGEKIHFYERVGRWPLKKAIQQAQILPWLRYTIQILMADNVIIGVFTPKGFWLAQSIYCEEGGEAWLPILDTQLNDLDQNVNADSVSKI